jgi:hypothetical protein
MGSRDTPGRKKETETVTHLFTIGKGINGVTRIY